jgi:hypothetical protein
MITFHRVLISTAILFCLTFAVWSLLTWSRSHERILLVLSVSFIVASAGLGYYLANLRRFLRL